MKQVKCKNCGSNITLEKNTKTTVCKYCGSIYITDTENAEQANNTTGKTIFDDLENQVKGLYNSFIRSDVKVENAPPRPKVNWLVAIILLCCAVWPGVIYLIAMAMHQKEWDDTYLK